MHNHYVNQEKKMKTDGRDARKTDRKLERGEIITNEI